MDVELPQHLEDFVRAQVRSGKYIDAHDVVRDALRRLQEIEAASAPTPTGLVREALSLAAQAQRDVMSLMQAAESDTDWLREIVGYATSAANSAYELVRRAPVARDVDRVLRGSVEQVTVAAERGEHQTRAMRQGLEATAKALGMLTTVLERVNAAGRALS